MRKSNRKIKMMSYWKHVMGTSVASCVLAEKLKKGDKFKLFSYGLVHDIGIIVLDTCFPELVEKIIEKMYTGMGHTSSERIYLDNLTHGDIGAWLCRRWNIREDIPGQYNAKRVTPDGLKIRLYYYHARQGTSR